MSGFNYVDSMIEWIEASECQDAVARCPDIINEVLVELGGKPVAVEGQANMIEVLAYMQLLIARKALEGLK